MNDLATILDIDLTRQDVQSLSSADAFAAFFARLGYNTDARTGQTAGNLGITADSTVRPIKKIELIADQEGLLQVYLFELQNVTVAHTRALARAFRNRAGNYLLILTSDYDRLDFVLLEKYLPANGTDSSSLTQKQVGIRPRILTVERLKPGTVHLRVLRRLTWTESDPFGQYDKLLSAYALADWSEEYFNNRALFSDYYLRERLPEFPVWKEDPKPAYLKLREVYQAAASRYAGKERKTLRQELVEPTLQALGFEPKPGRAGDANATEPHYRLYSARTKDNPLSLCLVYPWDRSLDGKDDRRDSETAEENPGAVVVSLLEKGESPWVVVTNGRLWRLYAKRTHARATNYYEIDLDEVLSQSGPHAPELAESFRYFWLLFRSQAFELAEVDREGKKQSLSLLDRLLLDSEEYAKELGERLKDRIFEDIFPHLAAGFIHFIRQRDGAHSEITRETLDTVYQGTLTLLYRLLFLLYAESRDLLPVKEVRGFFEASLTKLKKEIEDAAGKIEDEVEEKLKKHYREDSYELYDHLCRLFQIIDKGDPALNVPVYNGGLFLSDPEDSDDSPEAEAARFLTNTKVPDRFLARAIDLLARDVDRKRQDLVFIDFKSLGVRQLGSIYEGLLEFKLRIADRKLAIVKEKGRDVYKAFNELEKKDQERAERQKRIKKKGQIYLENDKHERKATGSYYTPDHIVKYIVEHAVGPILKEKFDAMRPRLREAQQKRKAFFEKQEALRKQGIRGEPESKAEFIGEEIVDELFNVKILDPAMGSGHFLVEAVDYITDKTLDFLNAFPWNPIIAHLFRMRETILQEMDDQGITIDPKRLTDVNLLKRHVLKRCIYGVDINPMAVELAKVSLWLDCFTLGAPLSFLDHHFRWGNSLIGVTVEEIDKIRAAKGQLLLSASSDWQGLLQAIQGMIEVGGLPDVTSAQVARSRTTYKSALSNLENFKKILDVHTARWFVEAPNGKAKTKKAKPKEDPFDYILKSGDLFEWSHGKRAPLLDAEPYRTLLSKSASASKEKRFFHWELEFPEVFYGPRPGTIQAIERLKDGGFEALIGNPPWGGLRTLGDLEDVLKSNYATAGKAADWFAFFLENALRLVTTGGYVGQVIPGGWQTSVESRELRKIVAEKMQIQRFVNLPYDVFPEAYTEAVIMTGRIVTDAGPAWRSATPSILICDRRERLSEISDSDPRWFRVACADWFKIEPSNFPFFTFWTQEVLVLGERILQMSVTLGSLADVQRGITPFFPTNREPSKRFAPALDGELLRYTYDFTGTQCVEYHEGIAEYKEPKYFRGQRTIVRQLISRQFRIQAVLTSEEFVVNQSHQIVLVTTPRYSPAYIASLLNSRLLSFLHVQGSALALRDDFPKLVLDDTRKLPIRRIDFITPQTQRRDHLRTLTNNYRAALGYVPKGRPKSDVYRAIFTSVVEHMGSACSSSDVMHDILAYLAEQMMDLNKQKRAGEKRFLGLLETALKIQPYKGDIGGIGCLTGKTILQDYLGDYQKGEEHAPFDSLWDVVQKNSRRLGCSVTAHFQERVREEYEKSLSILLPIKQKLASTDWLIDQLVYRLYGLTEEEIAVIEDKAG